MLYAPSTAAIAACLLLVAALLALSIFLRRRASSARGFFAANGDVHWAVNGLAFAGDFLAFEGFLGICGLVAFYGYDGFIYCLAALAGWILALFAIAGPFKRLGNFTFAGALDSRFNSRAIRLTASTATLVVSLLYLVPQMIGAGKIFKLLQGTSHIGNGSIIDVPFAIGVVLAGTAVIAIVLAAGMVSTTWAQFIKGILLIIICGIVTAMFLPGGLSTKDPHTFPRILSNREFAREVAPQGTPIATPANSPWLSGPNLFYRLKMSDGSTSTWILKGQPNIPPNLGWPSTFTECQTVSNDAGGRVLINGKPQNADNDLQAVNFVKTLPMTMNAGQPLGPLSFLTTMRDSALAVPGSVKITETLGGKPAETTVYFPKITSGNEILTPGQNPISSSGINPNDRLNSISLLLALFLGTAALPHVLIRYFTVKDEASARRSTLVALLAIALFFILALYLGLGAVARGKLDPSDLTFAAPLLAKALGNFAFALICAIAFTTVLGTACGVMMAASGAIAHDLLNNFLKINMDDRAQVRAGKAAAASVGLFAIVLGILLENANILLLIGWAFAIAASSILPALTMVIFWKGSTRQGIAASILVGLLSSIAWIALSPDACTGLYGLPAGSSPLPFSQPAIVAVPLSYATLVIVSLATCRDKLREIS